MRYILLFWALPMTLLGGWYYLSYHDMHFGYVFLSRAVHDFAFGFYADILGIEASTIPPLVARAIIVDTFLIFGILAFRRRRDIRAWIAARRSAQPSRDVRSA